MKRFFDIVFSLLFFFLFMPVFFVIAILIKASSKGNILHWSKRIGKNNHIFMMPKFRTMKNNTPQVATHLLENPDLWLTPLGKFLRAHSLDELPQLWNILKGEMSFVGPRPALFNQDDLIMHRTEKNIHTLLPGLTGWAQINGRDNLSISEKVLLDEYYLNNYSISFDLKILIYTIINVIKKEGIKH